MPSSVDNTISTAIDKVRYGRVHGSRVDQGKARTRALSVGISGLVELARIHTANADAMAQILAKLDALPARIMRRIPETAARSVQLALDQVIKEMHQQIVQALRTLAASAAGQTPALGHSPPLAVGEFQTA